jgi:putative endonuclease
MLYYVYLMANHSRMVYIGVTNDIERRASEHREKLADAYTKQNNITRLVYFEEHVDVGEAIAREKQLKGRRRAKKVALIESTNPRWRDLAEDW